LSAKTYKIGRRDADILLQGDVSISRLHAELLIKYDVGKCSQIDLRPDIVLTDLSKFGTYVNGERVNGFRLLHENDVLTFGALKSQFRLVNEPLIVTTSGLSFEANEAVRILVAQLGGYFLDEWQNDCQYVVMSRVVLSLKCVNALICARSICTDKYLEDLKNGSLSEKPLPDINDYIPDVSESNLKPHKNLLLPNHERRILLRDKTFVFFSRSHMKKLRDTIELASGKCELFDEDIHFSSLFDAAFVFMESDANDTNDYQTKITLILEKRNRGLVKESQIGLAVLFLDLDRYLTQTKSKSLNESHFSICRFQTQTQDEVSHFEPVSCVPSTDVNITSSMGNQPSQITVNDEPMYEDVIPGTPEKDESPKIQKAITEKDPLKCLFMDNKSCNNEKRKHDKIEKCVDDAKELEKSMTPLKKFKEEKYEVLEARMAHIKINKNDTNKLIEKREKTKSSGDTSIVYSKSRPPIKNELSRDHLSSQIQSFTETKRNLLKVNFKSLIVKNIDVKQIFSEENSMVLSNEKKNFKKFLKVPKLSLSDNSKIDKSNSLKPTKKKVVTDYAKYTNDDEQIHSTFLKFIQDIS